MERDDAILLTELKALEALISRLPAQHSYRKFLEVELHRTSAGKRGEEKLLKKLAEFNWKETHLILPDVSLSRDNMKIQLDSLLLTHSQAIIIESKNIHGKIHFDVSTGEFFRYDNDGKKTTMEDPAIQLKRNMRFFDDWLKSKKLDLAVKGLIVFTSKECEFISKPQNVPVCKTYQLHDYLYSMLEATSQQSPINLKKLKKLIESQQTPYKRIPLCDYYRIEPSILIKGVRCGKCGSFGSGTIKRIYWYCNKCGNADAHAMHNTLKEYFTLVSHTISNSELRKFSLLESRHAASRILLKYDLEISGEQKVRLYRVRLPN
ncbi:nuclease-related domain-containing protein [Planococcus halotolerans]|uniref:NERD domain-containing protein n=1 Tax=Planococcus halotolerans TaxID=2233542 RepID=A0A365KR60_9BACL|nr:nuclease-related domain-containing protein [Planococcus halotolerans]QHJ69375.1 NERD domain-containing protein [Planococcus halotolerans]RAZ75642.1 NERD domain-containing protein [Planococcus halotolerans]